MRTPTLSRALVAPLLCTLALVACEPPANPDQPVDVTLSGTVQCEGCGPVVVAVFDNPDEAGAPLADAVLPEPGAFSLALDKDQGDVWIAAFDDQNGNGGPDEGEAKVVAGPFLVADAGVDGIIIELMPTEVPETIQLSGELSCFEGCHVPLGIILLPPGDGDPVFETVVTELGGYSIDVPSDLGEVHVFAYEDLNQNREYDVGEFAGAHQVSVTLGSSDLVDVDVYIGMPGEDIELPGVLDNWGSNVAPGELIVYLDGGASASSIASAVGAEVRSDLDSLGAVVLTFPAVSLGDLQAMEAAVLAEDGVLRVERSAYVLVTEARGTDDNDALPSADTWAYDLLRTGDAKDQYDDCSYHFTEPAQFSRHVDIAIVDNDLLGASKGTEFAGLTRTFTDHHTTTSADPMTVGSHGSQVTSVIAANNNRAGMNGMLAGFSGSTPKGKSYKITYGLDLHNTGHGNSMSTAAVAAATEAALRGRASVVNISIGSYAKNLGHLRDIEQHRARLGKQLDAHPKKIVVLSAGNANRSLDTGFHKASLTKPNLIVVGAIQRDMRRWSGPKSGSNWGSFVDIAAPGHDVYVWAQDVAHNPAGSAMSTASFGHNSGTSFAAPIVTAHVAMMQAMDPSIAPSSVIVGLRRAADAGPASLSGDRVHFRRTVQAKLEGEINTTTEWLMDLDARPTFIGGDPECMTPDSRGGGHQCIPIIGENAWKSIPAAKDWKDHTYSLGGSLAGSTPTSKVEFDIEGDGITFGVGPLKTTYTGTVKADPGDPQPVPGDLYVEGTFKAATTGSKGPKCTYEGVWKGWLRRSVAP